MPTGELWYLPWESLPDSSGRPFGAVHEVAYFSAGDLRGLESAAVHPQGQVVAVSGGDLPAARREVGEVAALFPGAQTLLGAAALLGAVRNLALQARILHFATHSQVSGKDWNASFLRLADGPLSISDIFGWKIPRGALVVLSSCESGFGQAAPGREVASLARAFHFAGAGAVISSLWPVDDEATAALFEQFYRQLAKGRSPGAALQEAKSALRADLLWSHPAFWAGFVLQGDPR